MFCEATYDGDTGQSNAGTAIAKPGPTPSHRTVRRMSKVYIDTETCGLHSMMVLLQYAEEDGPIRLHEVWRRPIRETLRLIEWLTEHTVVGFNLVVRLVPYRQDLHRLPPGGPGLDSAGAHQRNRPAGAEGARWAVRQAGLRPGSDAPFPQGAVPVPHGPRRHPHQAGAFRAGLRPGR